MSSPSNYCACVGRVQNTPKNSHESLGMKAYIFSPYKGLFSKSPPPQLPQSAVSCRENMPVALFMCSVAFSVFVFK